MLLCGPLIDSDKAIKIINTSSMEEALEIANSDQIHYSFLLSKYWSFRELEN